MKIHPIKIDFTVAPGLERFVYIFLIEGRGLYLVDSGVHGSEQNLIDYLSGIGRQISEVAGLFLTHSHPDHIGAAARIKELSGCAVYACRGERDWMEDVEKQFSERPIPNFHKLLNTSVTIDHFIGDGDVISCEEGITLEVLETSGHSRESLSFLLREQQALFTGDAVPVPGDIPIYINASNSIETLERLAALPGIEQYFSAWSAPKDNLEGRREISSSLSHMKKIDTIVKSIIEVIPTPSDDEMFIGVCDQLGLQHLIDNPLFRKSIGFHLNELRG